MTANDLLPLEDYIWGFSHADFLIVNRLAWAFVGLIGVFAVFLILRRISSNWLALAGAAFLILTPLHTLFSTRVTPDGLATSIAIGALGFGIYYLKEPRFHYLIASALLAGLAAATKYNYGTVTFVSLLAYFLLLSRPLNIGHLINFTNLAMVSLGGFLLAMSSAIVRPVDFIIQVGREVKHYQTGSPSILANQSERWVGQLETQLSSLAGQWGSGLLVLALIGLIGLSLGGRYERGIFFHTTVPYLPFWLVMLSGSVNFHRNFLIYPLVAIHSILGMSFILKLTQDARWSFKLRLTLRIGLILPLTLLGGHSVTHQFTSAVGALEYRDSRVVAREFVQENLCETTEKIILDSRLRDLPEYWEAVCPGVSVSVIEPIHDEDFAVQIQAGHIFVRLAGHDGEDEIIFEIASPRDYPSIPSGPVYNPAIWILSASGK